MDAQGGSGHSAVPYTYINFCVISHPDQLESRTLLLFIINDGRITLMQILTRYSSTYH